MMRHTSTRTWLNSACAAMIVVGSSIAVFAEEDHLAQELTVDGAPVQAEIALECRFAKECLEDEDCADSGYAFSLNGRAGGVNENAMVAQTVLSDDAGNTDLLGVRQDGALSLGGGRFETRHMLTISVEGTARYTVHLADGPMMISYSGMCEGAK